MWISIRCSLWHIDELRRTLVGLSIVGGLTHTVLLGVGGLYRGGGGLSKGWRWPEDREGVSCLWMGREWPVYYCTMGSRSPVYYGAIW